MEIKGSTVIITGASRGIGRATAIEFGRKGAKVIVNYNKSRESAEEVVKKILEFGGEAVAVQGDVKLWEHASRIVNVALENFGTVDVLVNNAGILRIKSFLELEPRDWEEMFGVHVFGAFNMTRLVAPIMVEKRRGAIVNVSSIVGVKTPPGPGRVAYSAAKAALIGFTRALAIELAPYNVRVVAVAPGLTRTDMISEIRNLEERFKMIPLGRPAEPEDIARAIVFLASHDHITGEVLVVAGGE